MDVGVGVTHYEGNTNFINGNWYKNENNSNFNNEITGNRFIYLTNSSNTINGFIFSKLSDTTYRKYAVVSIVDGELEIYPNEEGTIGSRGQHFSVNGKVICAGQFSTDTLEDIAVLSNSGDTVKIYNGTGNGTLQTTYYKYYSIYPENFVLAQMSSFIYPYSIINNTTSDRDELVYREGQYIKILKNSNDNYFTPWISINTNFSEATNNDFKIADFNNDGFNDIVVVQDKYGIKVYKNNSGENFSLASDTVYYSFYHPHSVSTGDFNKDGFNDLAVIYLEKINIFLNNKSVTMFNFTPSYTYYFDFPVPSKVFPIKSKVLDLYNKGGLAVMFSGTFENFIPNLNIENLFRINASDTDAVPAPAYLFKELVQIGDIYRPKLILFNRGDRDFLKYKIYKKSPFTNYVYTLIDSTSNNYYIDYQETFTVGSGGSRPPENCFYYVKAEDYSYKVSVSSDTIGYPTILCPSCPNEENMYSSNSNLKLEMPVKYSITNFPNPFNPSTKIFFTVPRDGNVRITVYNSIGQEVKELINEFKNSGSYIVEFNSRFTAGQGSNLPSGVYYYRMEVNEYTAVRKMLLIK